MNFIKYTQQFALILSISMLGELLHTVLPFPVPTSIYGMVIMLLLLQFHIVRLEWVETAADYLLKIMPVMFLPAAARFADCWDEISLILVPLCVISLVVTFIGFFVSGHTAQFIIRKFERRTHADHQ